MSTQGGILSIEPVSALSQTRILVNMQRNKKL